MHQRSALHLERASQDKIIFKQQLKSTNCRRCGEPENPVETLELLHILKVRPEVRVEQLVVHRSEERVRERV